MTMNINNARMIDDAQLLQAAGGTGETTLKYAIGDMVYFYARLTGNPDKTPSGKLTLGEIVGTYQNEYYIASDGILYIAFAEDIVRLASGSQASVMLA